MIEHNGRQAFALRAARQPHNIMRFDGIIKTWNDERGFGFIESTQGGQEIFVHIKAFKGLRGRPQADQRVSFEVELGAQGKKRAMNVELAPVRRATAPRPRSSNTPTQWGTATLFVIPAFFLLLLAVHVWGDPPRWVMGFYLVASIVTYMVYARDKAAAKNGTWRTSEGTLHALAFLGGWPGALVAQQFVRHKSTKAQFRSVFWATVVLNVVALLVVSSHVAKLFLQA
ncbi:MAG TPA: cold shock and DUF1294 domain-containing protein [Aquabacterium sp.]|nr:cold shock and DUF1294 domain-containing protein [Aquabacterium sp.]